MSVTDNSSRSVPLPTARLVFRFWREEDLPLARELWGDPRVTRLVGGPFDDSAVRARLDRELENARASGIQYWAVFLASGEHVGCAGLKPRDRAPRIFELGFQLRPEHWGSGFATEAGEAIILHAFDVLGATELFAGHHPENAASRRALEKLGFVYVYDELYPPTGLMHPGYRLKR